MLEVQFSLERVAFNETVHTSVLRVHLPELIGLHDIREFGKNKLFVVK